MKIFIIEDEMEIVTFAANEFEELGHEVAVAETGEKGSAMAMAQSVTTI